MGRCWRRKTTGRSCNRCKTGPREAGHMKEIVLLGGPNGAGKTTAARVLLPEFLRLGEFLNADEIARRLSPGNPEGAAFAAGRELILRMRGNIEQESSFALETTCAGKSYLRLFEECRKVGWRITLLYFWLPSPESSIARVARRVREGGHAIPADVIRRRYHAGVFNMRQLYLPLANEAEIYDNSDSWRVLIAEKREGSTLLVHDRERWAKIAEAVQ
jgi:predicted ABC-type ATPase